MKKKTFLWHDYETNGIDTVKDRAAQFAAIRTDEDLNEIAEPIEIYALPHKDTLPNPGACFVTGITPNKIFKLAKDENEKSKVLNEYDFFRTINKEFSEPNTCVVGYNNISYDDEVSRNGFYRNLMNPYSREYMNGCSRWDLMNVVRLFAAIFPDDIKLPIVDGKPRFKLDLLTKENGIIHENAHDAVSDVRATIAMAKLIKDKRPDFWEYCLNNRTKKDIKNLIDSSNPVLYISPYFGSEHKYSEIILPISVSPVNANEYFAIKLTQPLEQTKRLLEEDPEKLKESLYFKKDDVNENVKPAICSFQINKCPVMIGVDKIKEMVQLTPENREAFYSSFGFNIKNMSENIKWIKENLVDLQNVLKKVYQKEEFPKKIDPDLAIYSSFFNDKDSAAINGFHSDLFNKDIAKYFSKENKFSDDRYDILARRIILRNFPDLVEQLPEKIKESWDKHCRSRLVDGYSLVQNTGGTERSVSVTFAEYFEALETCKTNDNYNESIANELTIYGNKLASVLGVDIDSLSQNKEKELENQSKSKNNNKLTP